MTEVKTDRPPDPDRPAELRIVARALYLDRDGAAVLRELIVLLALIRA